MGGFAAVDIGNTAVKVALFPEEGTPEVLVADSLEKALEMTGTNSQTETGYCTTRNLNRDEEKIVREKGWWRLTAERKLPIEVKYGSRHTLGADRVAAAVGAAALYPGRDLLVADLGTALTLDYVGGDATFHGGSISPGIAMRLKALHEFTSRLPMVDEAGEIPLTGHDTATAIRTGAVLGTAYEIAGAFCSLRKRAGASIILVTGGGGSAYFGIIKETVGTVAGNDTEIVLVPDLVPIGIKEAYMYDNER